MHLEYAGLVGPCAVCGEYVGNLDWGQQNVVAVAGPQGVVLAHAAHLQAGSGSAEYEQAVRVIAAAVAKQMETHEGRTV